MKTCFTIATGIISLVVATAHADNINYIISNPGTVNQCISKINHESAPCDFKPSPTGTHVGYYSTTTHTLFETLEYMNTKFASNLLFENNTSDQTFCFNQNGIQEPQAYCSLNSNQYIELSTEAKYHLLTQNITFQKEHQIINTMINGIPFYLNASIDNVLLSPETK